MEQAGALKCGFLPEISKMPTSTKMLDFKREAASDGAHYFLTQ
jgi:hypothetical protein